MTLELKYINIKSINSDKLPLIKFIGKHESDRSFLIKDDIMKINKEKNIKKMELNNI